MNKNNVLIINNDQHLPLPTESEIQSRLALMRFYVEKSIDDAVPKIHSGEYKAIILCQEMNEGDCKRIAAAINFRTLKPSIIVINNRKVDCELLEDSIREVCIFVRNDQNLKENLIFALDVALKRYKLYEKIAILNEKLRQAKVGQNIVDLTLSYNNEINNILTSMIGNIQLILKTSSNLDPNTLAKLSKIDENAQRILKMASYLVDLINAPSETLPLEEFENQ